MPYDIEKNNRWPSPHHNFVPEFQMSGIPYVETRTISTPPRVVPDNFTSLNTVPTECVITFDQVTRWINIVNHAAANNGNHLRIYFNETAFKNAKLNSQVNGNGNNLEDPHYYMIDGQSETNRLEVKCKKIWIWPAGANTTFSVFAGLTNISANTFPDQLKANGFTGVED